MFNILAFPGAYLGAQVPTCLLQTDAPTMQPLYLRLKGESGKFPKPIEPVCLLLLDVSGKLHHKISTIWLPEQDMHNDKGRDQRG